MRVIGLMSGTSLDGIDAALVRFEGSPAEPDWTLERFLSVGYTADQRGRIHDAIVNGTAESLCRLHASLGEWLAEAALAFLGLGVPAATNPSWGADINAARNNFPIHLWWAFFPGVAISLTVLAFNLLGDSLRDIFDPRLRGSR